MSHIAWLTNTTLPVKSQALPLGEREASFWLCKYVNAASQASPDSPGCNAQHPITHKDALNNVAFSCNNRYWDHEVQKATKELRTPGLSKAIIRCYWKSYALLGLFTLIEVSVFSFGKEVNRVFLISCFQIILHAVENSFASFKTSLYVLILVCQQHVCHKSKPFISFPAYQEVIKVIQPVILGKMIMYFENYDPDNKTALYETLGYAAALSTCTIGLALIHHLYFYHVQRAGMKIRVAMCHMIYKKVSRGTACLCFSRHEI